MEEEKCVPGCKSFTGGEVKHHPSCPFYPESISRIYDEMSIENKRLKKELIVTDELLSDRQLVLDTIPECSVHGGNCIPHAIEWIIEMKNKYFVENKDRYCECQFAMIHRDQKTRIAYCFSCGKEIDER